MREFRVSQGEPVMFLSRYLLSAGDRRQLGWKDTYSLHRIVYSLFEGGQDGGRDFLFVDKGRFLDLRQVLILSDREPLNASCGWLETRALPEEYLKASMYAFETVINPVRVKNGSGQRIPITGSAEILDWLCGHSSWGFAVHGSRVVIRRRWTDSFVKAGHRVTIAKAQLHGVLTVTDRELFTRSACRGIGRSRAFGCGLLQLVPIA